MRVAETLGAEIVSADSRQVYRGMDIGTAKPSHEERERVRHHLIDVAEPGERYDALRYQREARAAVMEIRSRGRLAIVVGGTGLYVRALLDGLDLASLPHDPTVRARLESADPSTLYARLRVLDPEAAARVDPRGLARSRRRVWRPGADHLGSRRPCASGASPRRQRARVPPGRDPHHRALRASLDGRASRRIPRRGRPVRGPGGGGRRGLSPAPKWHHGR